MYVFHFPTFLGARTEEALKKEMDINAEKLTGLLGRIDCTHWTWEKCPMVWAGQFQSWNFDSSLRRLSRHVLLALLSKFP